MCWKISPTCTYVPQNGGKKKLKGRFEGKEKVTTSNIFIKGGK
jgi:hypothetical protein